MDMPGGVAGRWSLRAFSAFTVILLSIAGVVVASRPAAAVACDTFWASPGSSNSWATPGAWTNGVPTSSTVACLPDSATPYTVFVFGTAAAKGLIVGSGVTLQLQGEGDDGNASLTVGATGLSNNGTIQLTSMDGAFDDTLALPSGTLTNSGTISSEPGAGGNRFLNSTIDNDGVLSATTNTVINGTLNNTASQSNAGRVTVGSGVLLYAATLANFNVATHTLSSGYYDVSGTLDSPNFDVQTIATPVWLHASGAGFKITGGGSGLTHLSSISYPGQLLMTGVSLTVPSLQVASFLRLDPGSTLTSTGTITVTQVATLNIAAGAVLSAANGTTVASGQMFGGGTVKGALHNNSQVEAFRGEQLTVVGPYTQSAAAVLVEEPVGTLGSLGRLVVKGTATLGGAVQMYVFGPNTSASATLLTATKRVGTFKTVTFSILSDGARPVAKYSGGTVTLTGTPLLQDDDIRVGLEHWTPFIQNANLTFGRASAAAGDSLSYRFTGTAINFQNARGPDQGIAAVAIDGKSRGTIDLYAPSLSFPYVTTYSGLAKGTHTLTVKVTGTKNPSSSGTTITILGFAPAQTWLDIASPSLTVGGWTTTSSTAASGGTYRSATTAGRVARVTFTGTGITWITQTCPGCGKAQVSIDGGLPVPVDLYSSATVNKVPKPFTGLTSGAHSLTITVLGTKRTAATGTKVVVDAFSVTP
jgi:hypothetical protein